MPDCRDSFLLCCLCLSFLVGECFACHLCRKPENWRVTKHGDSVFSYMRVCDTHTHTSGYSTETFDSSCVDYIEVASFYDSFGVGGVLCCPRIGCAHQWSSVCTGIFNQLGEGHEICMLPCERWPQTGSPCPPDSQSCSVLIRHPSHC